MTPVSRSAVRPGPLLDAAGRTLLVGMDLPALEDFCAGLGEPRYRARQLFGWLYQKGVKAFAEMTNLPAALRARLDEVATATTMEVQEQQFSQRTGTTKFLMRLLDGNTLETVAMRQPYGISVCVSSQVGCRMGCQFCASTLRGLVRNCSAGEIVDQVIMVNRHLPEGERVSSVVIMGAGEPLENYDAVVQALRLLHHPEGLHIGYRHITLSTCGLAPEMRRLAREGLPVRLALSLHAPDDDLRARLMPVSRTYPVQEALAAAREYGEATGRRVTYEHILIAGVNDQDETAHRLGELLRGGPAHVNLIPMNPIAERDFAPTPRDQVERFRAILEGYGLYVTVRKQMGEDIDAACGQLRHKRDAVKRR